MPTDIQFKDDLRKQRDNWRDILDELEAAENFNTDIHIQAAYKLAKREYERILESLQD